MPIPSQPTLACSTCHVIVPVSRTLMGATGPVCERCHAQIEAEIAAHVDAVEANDARGHFHFGGPGAASIAERRRAPAVAEPDDAEDGLIPSWRFPHPLDYVAGAAAAAPFIFSFKTGLSPMDGELFDRSWDWVDLIGGPVAVIFGLITLTLLRATARRDRRRRLATSAFVVIIGLGHFVVGSGVFL